VVILVLEVLKEAGVPVHLDRMVSPAEVEEAFKEERLPRTRVLEEAEKLEHLGFSANKALRMAIRVVGGRASRKPNAASSE